MKKGFMGIGGVLENRVGAPIAWGLAGGDNGPTSIQAAPAKAGGGGNSSWRHLNYLQQSRLRRALEKVPKGNIAFNIQPLVADAESFAQDIAHALVQAGFKLEDGSSNQPLPAGSGIRVVSQVKADFETGKTLARALTKLGFPAVHEKRPSRNASRTIWIDIGRA